MAIKRRPWAVEEIAELKKLATSETWEEIGKRLNRHPDEARRKANKLKFYKKNISKANPNLDGSLYAYSQKYGIRKTTETFKVSIDRVKNARRRFSAKLKRNRKYLEGDGLKKFQERCKAVALSNGIGFLLEDFINYAVVKVLEGRYTGDVKFILGDFIATFLGRSTVSDRLKAIRYAEHNALKIVEDEDFEDRDSITVMEKEQESKDILMLRASIRITDLKMHERATLILMSQYGCTLNEVGDVLGMSLDSVLLYRLSGIKKVKKYIRMNKDGA